MKLISIVAISSSLVSALTKEDIIFIISVIITILNLLQGYLERKSKKGEK